MLTREKQKPTGKRIDGPDERNKHGGKSRIPLLFYPVLIMFGIYLLWEVSARLFDSSP